MNLFSLLFFSFSFLFIMMLLGDNSSTNNSNSSSNTTNDFSSVMIMFFRLLDLFNLFMNNYSGFIKFIGNMVFTLINNFCNLVSDFSFLVCINNVFNFINLSSYRFMDFSDGLFKFSFSFTSNGITFAYFFFGTFNNCM